MFDSTIASSINLPITSSSLPNSFDTASSNFHSAVFSTLGSTDNSSPGATNGNGITSNIGNDPNTYLLAGNDNTANSSNLQSKPLYPSDYEQTFPNDPVATTPANPLQNYVSGMGSGSTQVTSQQFNTLFPDSGIGDHITRINNAFDKECQIKRGIDPTTFDWKLGEGLGKFLTNSLGAIGFVGAGEEIVAVKVGSKLIKPINDAYTVLNRALLPGGVAKNIIDAMNSNSEK